MPWTWAFHLTRLARQAIQRWPRQAALILIAFLVLGAVNAFVAGKFDPAVPLSCYDRPSFEGVAGPVDPWPVCYEPFPANATFTWSMGTWGTCYVHIGSSVIMGEVERRHCETAAPS